MATDSLNYRFTGHRELHQFPLHLQPSPADSERLRELQQIQLPYSPCSHHCEICNTQYPVDRAEIQTIIFDGQKHGTFYQNILEVPQASAIMMDRIKNVRGFVEELKPLLQDYGNLIMRKWFNKSKSQREQTVLSIRPDAISPKAWAWLRCMGGANISIRKAREMFLVHSIDVDGLATHPARLLGLLFFRTKHPCEEFVRFDYRELLIPWAKGQLPEDYVDGAFIMSGEKFGTWTEWDRDELHSMYAFGGPRALMVMESQEILLTFLTTIAKRLIGDTPAERSGNDLLLKLVEDNLRTSKERTLSLHTTLKYLSPPIFDLQEMTSIVKACSAAARNDLQCRKIHNDYFHELLHGMQVRQNQTGGGGVLSSNSHVIDLCLWPVIKAKFWCWIEAELDKIRYEYEKHHSTFSTSLVLPEDYEKALQALDGCVTTFAGLMANFVNVRYQHLMKDWQPDQMTDKDVQTLYKKDRFVWCLMHFVGHDRKAAIQLVVAEMDSMLQENTTAHLHYDENLQGVFGDMGAIWRITEISRFQYPFFRPKSVSDFVETEGKTSTGCKRLWFMGTWLYIAKMLGRDFTATKPLLSDPSAFALRNRNQDLKWLAKDDARSWAISNVWEIFEDELREALLTEKAKTLV